VTEIQPLTEPETCRVQDVAAKVNELVEAWNEHEERERGWSQIPYQNDRFEYWLMLRGICDVLGVDWRKCPDLRSVQHEVCCVYWNQQQRIEDLERVTE
jgi:hypothetical protein